jgi:hypothetical protein
MKTALFLSNHLLRSLILSIAFGGRGKRHISIHAIATSARSPLQKKGQNKKRELGLKCC